MKQDKLSQKRWDNLFQVSSGVTETQSYNINWADVEGGRDSDRFVVTILWLIGTGTVLFGFIQACEAYAPQTAEYLLNV